MGLIVKRVSGSDIATGSLTFVTNAPDDNEYARLSTLPDGFGDGEFTFEIRILADDTVGLGDTSVQDSDEQRTLWSSNNIAIYGDPGGGDLWWYYGNFLLDGHNNSQFYSGTFSIQIASSGNVQWTFGDGAAANERVGDVHGLRSTTDILDGNAHTITLVRRWDGGTGAILELYIDGAEEDTETSTARTNMATTYWDDWTGYPPSPSQAGWFFGSEKQACLNILNQYEDFKGRVGEIRFWNVARSAAEIAGAYSTPIPSATSGLVGVYRIDEGAGSTASDELASGGDITLTNGAGGQTIAWAGSVF